jgi:signal transduction histidine kinase
MDVSTQVELEQRKDDFMSMASHELKTPVTSIKGYTQLLIRKFEKEGMDEPVAYLTRMDNQIDKLTRLIRDLLDVSKAQTGKLDYEEAPIDIDRLVRETIESVQQTTTTHTLILHDTSHAIVLGDSERLSQVLINLLSNAIKYSPRADHVDVHVVASSNTVIINVQDYGVGIAKEHHAKLSERFYRVYGNSNKLFPGLGIGLYISYEIVKRHHGEITLTSEEGKGSTFSITLPLAPRSLDEA